MFRHADFRAAVATVEIVGFHSLRAKSAARTTRFANQNCIKYYLLRINHLGINANDSEAVLIIYIKKTLTDEVYKTNLTLLSNIP